QIRVASFAQRDGVGAVDPAVPESVQSASDQDRVALEIVAQAERRLWRRVADAANAGRGGAGKDSVVLGDGNFARRIDSRIEIKVPRAPIERRKFAAAYCEGHTQFHER